MTVSSVAGASAGKTQITVSPAKSVQANKYKYKIQSSDFTLPELDDDLTAWSDWDGTSEIDATNGYTIAVAETEPDYSCERVGKTIVVSPSPEPEGDTYTDGTTSFTVNDGSFVLNQNGTVITGTAKESIPQTEGVSLAYFLEYTENGGDKFGLVEISGTEGNYTLSVEQNASIYNRARFSSTQSAYIPITITQDHSSNFISPEAVENATSNMIMFDSTAPVLTGITMQTGKFTLQMGTYGYSSTVNYGEDTSTFDSMITITADRILFTTVTTSDSQFNYMVWGASKYSMDTENNTFTVKNRTIQDPLKLEGTWAMEEDQTIGGYLLTFTYGDSTVDQFSVIVGEDSVPQITHIEQQGE